MIISDNNLKKLYREYLKDTTAVSREKCPNPETILKSLRSPYYSKKKATILDHISQCFHCAQEFDFVLSTLRQESDLYKEIEETAPRTSSNSSLSSLPRKFPKLIPVVALLSVMIMSVGYFTFKYVQKKEFRTLRASPLELTTPVDRSVGLNELVFEWAKFAKISYYKIEVFDESLLPIWKSKDIYSNYIKAPPNLLRKLNRSETYFWMVTAVFSDGRILESRLEGFSIKK